MTLMRPSTVSGANLIPAKAGIGLRFQHHQVVLDTRPDVAWMEVHTENYMGGGTPLRYLDAIRRDTPISLHGVGLSLGSAEGIDPAHLERIRKVAERIEPGLMSEHIAWNLVGGTYLADLLPLPMTEEALEVVCRHVDQTQTYLRRAGMPRPISPPCRPKPSAKSIWPDTASRRSLTEASCASTIMVRASVRRYGDYIKRRWRVSVRYRP